MNHDPFESARAVNDPASVEAEERLLACCLLDGVETMSKAVLAGTTPASFSVSGHSIIFDVLLELYAAQKPIEIAVLAEELRTKRKLEDIGGYSFLVQISKSIPTTSQAGYFIEKVREQATLRAIIQACAAATDECANFTGDMQQLTAKIDTRMGKAMGRGLDDSEEPFNVVAAKMVAEIQSPNFGKEAPINEVSWGLLDLDKACGRMCPGNLVILAGMPSTGKSALADQLAWKHAKTGSETLIFTYEMTKREKAIRIAQQESQCNYDALAGAPSHMKAAFIASMQAVANCKNLHVFEKDVTVNRVVSRVRAFVNRGKKVGLIVVDFLQYLARLEPQIGRERTDEKIGRMIAALKQISRECECPILLLSSINREGYKDGNRPTMANLKASGEIESDGDVVAILHWPKENPITKQDQDPFDSFQSQFYVEFNQEKGRSKGVQQVGITFTRKATRFDNFQR